MRLWPKKSLSSSLSSTDDAEKKKTSYWLEKLFRQREAQQESKMQQQETQLQSNEQVTLDNSNKRASHDKGVEEADKTAANKKETDKKTLENMVIKSNRILTSRSSVFPWDFFPTTITIEATRITIIHRQLFSSQVHSIDIKDISNIFIDCSILFAQLTIISSTFLQNEIKINRLWKKDAVFVRRIIEGLRMFEKEKIDTSVYTVKELLTKLKELSTTKIVM